ncbi:hypothetical protein GGR52DRAFT_208235 [Hypoxylon sp. FL1284]|nr:hypothetical protein GGR52DRAFT_208235 [Hypoxylon sp. FL1284]
MSENRPSTGSKAEPHFHLFRLLPPEIRRDIYILATPPRVVLVNEDGECEGGCDDKYEGTCTAKYEAFLDRCRNTVVQFNLHPDIAYFAHNWRPQLNLSPTSQSPLESYGFTSSKQQDPHYPWTPTEETPQVSPLWLAEHPTRAYDMTRDATLSSSAPIPPFLHVCSESRGVLMRHGYQLAFGTRTHGARTWFHFERDTLYLAFQRPYTNRTLLSGGPWDVGLFRPADLQKVKKLALQDSSTDMPGLLPVNNLMASEDRLSNWCARLLWLLPNVQELLLVDWDPPAITRWADHISRRQHPSSLLHTDIEGGLENRLVCVPVDEVDAVARSAPYGYGYDAYSLEYKRSYYRLKAFKESGSRTRFFETESDRFRELLSQELELLQKSSSASRSGRVFQEMPRIYQVHVCPLQATRLIFIMRQQFWAQYLEAKKRLERGRLSKLRASRRAAKPVTYQDVGEAYLRAHEPDEDETLQFLNAHYELHIFPPSVEFTQPSSPREKWWLTRGLLFSPRFNII